jgi:hypothetical protein
MPLASPTRSVITVPGNHSLATDLEAVAAAVRSWLPHVVARAGTRRGSRQGDV